jgi:two-component system, NtrC family, response regulator
MAAGSVLIIDDEEQLRKLLKRIVSLEGYDVAEAGTLKLALQSLQHKPADVVLCDVKLPDGNGVDFTTTTKKNFPSTEIILLTAYGNIPDGVQAIKNGAFDYITKGDDHTRILPLLAQAMEKVAVQKRSAVKIKEQEGYHFSQIIGESSAIKNAIRLAQRISTTDTTVLLLGETGTGKEVFADAIHTASSRAANPFVAINCSAFTKELLESELFGYKAGAFTNAAKDKKGLIETADGGTLFLDEIGEMNIELQAKLLRVLENETFIKLGDTKTTKVDVRIIAATNRDLEKEIAAGHFREDLYYRLNVFTIHLPPLRERIADIPALANYFVKRIAPQMSISPAAMQSMQQYGWKGNIRELRNVINRASIIAEENLILPADLPFDIQKEAQAVNNLSLSAVEKQHIQKVLQHTRGNKTETARLLDIGLTTLYRKMEEYSIPK